MDESVKKEVVNECVLLHISQYSRVAFLVNQPVMNGLERQNDAIKGVLLEAGQVCQFALSTSESFVLW